MGKTKSIVSGIKSISQSQLSSARTVLLTTNQSLERNESMVMKNRYILALIFLFSSATPVNSQVFTHQSYKELWSKNTVKTDDGDLCVENTDSFSFWCVAGTGPDQLMRPKLTGWVYVQMPLEEQPVHYLSPRFNRLKLNGQEDRFIYHREVHRSIDPGYEAIAPSIENVTQGSTNCSSSISGSMTTRGYSTSDGYMSGYISPAPSGFGYISGSLSTNTTTTINSDYTGRSSTDCTHNPGYISINPGRPRKDPSFKQELVEVIVDCSTMKRTYQIIGGHTWQRVAIPSNGRNSMRPAMYNEACFSYNSLPKLNLDISNNIFKDF